MRMIPTTPCCSFRTSAPFIRESLRGGFERLAREHVGNYDGWEAPVDGDISAK